MRSSCQIRTVLLPSPTAFRARRSTSSSPLLPLQALVARPMSSSSPSSSRALDAPLPVIAIVGTTGVGKSKLAIEIAKHLLSHSSSPSELAVSPPQWTAGEVINADSMQIFKGLDVITNKVTEEEKEGVGHRLIGVVDPRGEKGWGMKRWVEVTLAEVRFFLLRSFSCLIAGHQESVG